MAVDFLLYALPIEGGLALVAPSQSVDGLASATHLLRRTPQPVRIVVLASDGMISSVNDVSRSLVETVARDLYRRAAVRASLPQGGVVLGLDRRSHALVMLIGWLFLLFAEQRLAYVVAGMWLAVGYPLMRRASRNRAQRQAVATAESLHAVGRQPQVELSEHAGLTLIAHSTSTAKPGNERALYAQIVDLLPTAGLLPLASFCAGRVGRAQSDTLWAAVRLTPAIQTPEHDPTVSTSLEGQVSRTSLPPIPIPSL